MSRVQSAEKLDAQHLSVRVLSGYIQYIRKHHPNVDPEGLVIECGLPRVHVADDSNWVSQVFMSRFMRAAIRETGDALLAYKVGRASVSEEVAGPLLVGLARHVLSVSSIYKSCARFSGFLNKMYRFEVSTPNDGQIELRMVADRSILRDEVQLAFNDDFENLVNNTRGWLEAIPILQGMPAARVSSRIVEVESLRHAEFEVQLPTFAVGRTRYLPAILATGTLGSAAMKYSPTLSQGFAYSLSIAGAGLALFFWRQSLGRRKALARSEQALAALDRQYQVIQATRLSLEQEDTRVSLLKEILEPARAGVGLSSWLEWACGKIAARAGFPRVTVFLTDDNETHIHPVAFYGAEQELIEQFSVLKLPLQIDENGDSKLSNVFWNRRSVLVSAGDHAAAGNDDTKHLVLASRSNSFAAVPIYTDRRRFGVLIADRGPAGGSVTEADLSVLETIGRHLALVVERERTNLTQDKFVPWKSIKLLGCESILDVRTDRSIQRNLTVLFCDLRGFSRLCEAMSPEDIYRTVNSLFSALTPAIDRFNGFVDKFVGDQIMAVFERPEDGVAAATEIVRALADYNARNRNTDRRPPLSIGVGVNSGQMTIGPVGSGGCLSITVVSSDVNVGARLEELTKYFKCQIIAPSSIVDSVKSMSRTLGVRQIRGTDRVVRISEIYSNELGYVREFKQSTRQGFEAAVELIDRGEFEGASLALENHIAQAESRGIEDVQAQVLLEESKRRKTGRAA